MMRKLMRSALTDPLDGADRADRPRVDACSLPAVLVQAGEGIGELAG